MPPADPLEGLRTIRLPPEAAAPWSDLGFAVAAGLLAALILSLVARMFLKPRRSLRRSAMEAFAAAAALPVDERRAAQAALLRRVVRTVEGDAAARATGAAWAETLDRTFSTDLFSKGAGGVFVDGLYARPAATSDGDALDRRLGALIAGLRR